VPRRYVVVAAAAVALGDAKQKNALLHAEHASVDYV